MNIVFHNGNWESSGSPLLKISNRSFLYGDGLFESMLWKDGRLHFPGEHLARLKKGMMLFEMAIPEFFNEAWLVNTCHALTEKNAVNGMARIRLHVYREGGGFYTPQENQTGYVLSCFPLHENYSSSVKSVGIFQKMQKPKCEISNYKTTSAAIYVLAGLYARKNGFDDAFILNTDNHITDAVSSNVFLIRNNELLTPPLSDGCIDGVFRRHVLNCCVKAGLKGVEKSITAGMLLEAEELFLTNAVAGIRSVLRFSDKNYSTRITDLLRHKMLA